MKKNNIKPWESALTEKTVYASGGFISPIDKLETDVRIIESRYPHKRESSRSGYLRSDVYALIPYSGRFGDGYIIAIPRTGSSVKCTYYLNHGKRGEQNAETQG